MRRALVTGGNRGLGLETCRQLARRGVAVALGARDRGQGERAIEALRRDALDAELVQLDIADDASVRAAAEAVGAIDILVANAAIAMRGFDEHVARTTIDVNYFGTARVIDTFLPRMREPASIVVVSSGLGELSIVPEKLRARFASPALARSELDELMRAFVRSVENGTRAAEGWPATAYGVSKLGVNTLVRVLSRDLAGRKIAVNAVCPGWVKTRMGGSSAPRDVEEGADTIVWAALFEGGEPSGAWFRDRARVGW